MRERLRADYSWTDRQRQVLELLAAGKTNADIAEELGISRDGAKWHVGEILSKLQASSREEAAEYWRRRNGLAPRFARVFRGIVASTAVRWIAGGAASGAVVAGIVVATGAIRTGGGANISPSMSRSPTAEATTAPFELSDGTQGYDYKPQLAYVDENGDAWLINSDGSGKTSLFKGCDANQTLKASGVFTAGLEWAANGEWVSCQRSDFSVISRTADGRQQGQPFQAGGCQALPDWAPDDSHMACYFNYQEGPRLNIVPSRGGNPAIVENFGPGHAWSPDGDYVITQIGPIGNRVGYALTTVQGTRVATIGDAYAGTVDDFSWHRDGSRLAYPSTDGIVVLNSGDGSREVISRDSLPPLDVDGQDLLTGGIHIDWVLGGKAVLIHRYTYAALVDLPNGRSVTLPAAFGSVTMAPDGMHGWTTIATDDGQGWQAAFVNVETRSVSTIPDSAQSYTMSTGPTALFSGDSKRACWVPAPGNKPEAYCAEVAGGPAVKVAAPVQVEPDTMGYGDYSILWRAFSPDLTKIAYTVPGLSSTGPQTLMVSNLDGSDAVSIGPAIGAIPYRWRPDGVYHPPSRTP